jgi:hypothetical protein
MFLNLVNAKRQLTIANWSMDFRQKCSLVLSIASLLINISPLSAIDTNGNISKRKGDWIVIGNEKVTGQHILLDGNLVIKKAARLELQGCTLEIIGKGSREHFVDWQGGTLVTKNVTIGGYVRPDGVPIHTVFHLYDGLWEAEDTIVQYAYGVSFHAETRGILRGIRMNAGPRPDAIIASGKADIELTDSSFPLALGVYCNKGGHAQLNLPIKKPVTTIFDGTNTPGVEYTMKLTRHIVPDMWFLFLRRMSMNMPQCTITIQHCPKVLVSLLGHNLNGQVRLSKDLSTLLKLGSTTLCKADEPVGISMYSVYCSGDKTDLTVKGPAIIAELMQWGGQLAIQGSPGKNDLMLLCTTLELKGSAKMNLQNVHLGRPLTWSDQENIGEANVGNNALLQGTDISINRVVLHTRDMGRINLDNVEELGDMIIRKEGGSIITRKKQE